MAELGKWRVYEYKPSLADILNCTRPSPLLHGVRFVVDTRMPETAEEWESHYRTEDGGLGRHAVFIASDNIVLAHWLFLISVLTGGLLLRLLGGAAIYTSAIGLTYHGRVARARKLAQAEADRLNRLYADHDG